MPKIKILFLYILLSSFSVSPLFAGPGSAGKYFPGMLVVKLNPDTSASLNDNSKDGNLIKLQHFMRRYQAISYKSVLPPGFAPLALKAVQRHNVNPDVLTAVESNLSRIYIIHYDANIDPKNIADKINRMSWIEYAEPLFIRKTTASPNDPAYVSNIQAYLKQEKFDLAWNTTTGDSNIIIAIIDSGVDYTNPDLQGKMWTNPNETLDNKDDDGDGLIDDVKGWDFWESGPISNPTSDNDPIAEYSSHGTHVAGIAAANTNNGVGIAGAGYNCKFMAVKAGGTKDFPDVIGYGFSGIMYAAEHGADVINCSWGSAGYSQAEQDIINAVTKMGSVVVCAAGNNNSSNLFYPASYKNTISVASVDNANAKSSFSNYGHTVDVAATGEGIYSTVMVGTGAGGGNYAYMQGTSMAAPMVSGLAGLIKKVHSNWSAYHIASQIRSTATMIDNVNTNYTGDLGHGLIDAEKAVTASVPGLSVVSYKFINSTGGKLSTGQSGTLDVTVTNNNSTTQNATFVLSSSQSGITVINNTVTKGAIALNDTISISFPISIASDFPLNTIPEFRLDMSDNASNYTDFSYLDYAGLLYDITQINDIQMSVSSDGSFGYMNPYGTSDLGGVGFNIKDSQTNSFKGNYLFSSGLMIYDFGKPVANNVRYTDFLMHGFKPLTPFRIQTTNTSSEGTGTLDTSPVSGFPLLEIKMNTYAFSGDTSISKVVWVRYAITNQSGTTVGPMYVGLHNDWDLGSGYSNNTGFDAQDSLLFVYDTTDANQPYIAVAQMGNISSNLAIDNGYSGPADHYHFSIYYDPTTPGYDGYTDLEKRYSLMAKDSVTIQTNTDVSVATGSGPYILASGATVNVGFIFAYGNNKGQLISQVRAARAKQLFNVDPNSIPVSIETPKEPQLPSKTKLWENYPNPFNPSTQIKFDLAKTGPVDLSIYNILGQKVATLVAGEKKAGSYTIIFNANNLSSGIYFSILKTKDGIQTKKMTLIK